VKIKIFSDLHNEFEPCQISAEGCDIIILAGDIHSKGRSIDWIQSQNIIDTPILFVLGNHEYYEKSYPKLVDDFKKQTMNSNIHVLENDVFRYRDVNFLGCTLWTDFELLNDPMSSFHCHQQMNDYQKIKSSPHGSKLQPNDTKTIHKASVHWLRNELEKLHYKKNIVITHHAPSMHSIPEYQRNDVLNPAYASDLSELILDTEPDFWVHGHIHKAVSYEIGVCEIISNPKGYPQGNLWLDNYEDLIIEIN
jgi:predicted phosphohydrolase